MSEVFDGNGILVDNLNDWPHRNGAFSVGDTVALVSWFGDNVVADTIIAATPVHSEDAEGNLKTMCYELEGGGQVYWSTLETSWNTNVEGFRGSVRRPFESEYQEYRMAPAAAGMGL